MIENGKNYNDINNYRNSRYFVKSVNEARRWNSDKNELVIFAGACQSYYEAIMSAGANFASSPARILIDFMDPLIVAEDVSITNKNKLIMMSDLEGKIRNGRRAVTVLISTLEGDTTLGRSTTIIGPLTLTESRNSLTNR